MKKPMVFVANWKMNMPFKSGLSFIQDNVDLLAQLNDNHHKKIILCPSFPFLMPIKKELNQLPLFLGAQNCSEHAEGPFTGQVSAHMLAEAGCNYCIIGHSECRSMLKETNEQIAAKATQLIKAKVIPIICIGETLEQKMSQKTTEVLCNQLTPLIKELKQHTGTIYIAYEPIWAIGTGKTPSGYELEEISAFLVNFLNQELPNTNTTLLYGGSVNEANTQEILNIPAIGGLLIGGASLDFKNFQKIVSLSR